MITPKSNAGEVGFAPERLDSFLRKNVSGLAGDMQLARIGGGQSNPTFFVSYSNRRLVLRKQPAGEILPSAHAVDREFRVMQALAETGVPVPPVVLFHADRDVVGTPFYIMGQVDGRVFHDSALPGLAPQERRAMYFAMAETLARLHSVDPVAVGLADFGKPGNYFKRQIDRWTRQWQTTKFREIPEMDVLVAWLPPRIPTDEQTVVCHGDYRLGNLMFHPSEPRVVAVLDWELATLGHPLADAAYSCCLAWHSRPEWYKGVLGLDIKALGIPSEAEYLDRYYAASRGGSGRVETFHLVFALFRFAAILEGIASRVKVGTAAAVNAAEVGDLSVAYARHACAIIEQRG